MAKKSKIAKASRTPKFSTRSENRCLLCGRPRAVYRKFGVCRICFRNTDPIADMLPRIRNALVAKHETVDVPASNMKLAIAEILLNEGYIKSYTVNEEGVEKMMNIVLKYGPNKQRVITGLKRVSKPGCRVYSSAADLKPVLNGLGVSVVSTSKGLLSDREAKSQQVGGEIICEIW